MPYSSINDLPSSIRNALPTHAQRIYLSAFNSAYSQYKDDSRSAAIAWAAVKRKYKKNEKDEWVAKSEDWDSLFIDTGDIVWELKGEVEEPYVVATISNTEIDQVKDMMTPSALKKIVDMINGKSVALITTAEGGDMKVNLDHEHILKDKRILPRAKVVKAWLEKTGSRLEAKAKILLNKDHPEFEMLRNNINNGFIDGVSIEFKAKNFEMVNGVRKLIDVLIGGLAFTGRPVCRTCKITEIAIKSFAVMEADELEKKDMEDDTMTEEEQPKVETEIVETKAVETEVAEEQKPAEQPDKVEVKSEVKADETDYKALFEAKSKEFEELKTKVEAIEKKLEVKGEAEAIVKSELDKMEVKAKDLVEQDEEKFENKSMVNKDFKTRLLESKGIKTEVK